jgi:hypothetical protein
MMAETPAFAQKSQPLKSLLDNLNQPERDEINQSVAISNLGKAGAPIEFLLSSDNNFDWSNNECNTNNNLNAAAIEATTLAKGPSEGGNVNN